jgi:hypothetical protein
MSFNVRNNIYRSLAKQGVIVARFDVNKHRAVNRRYRAQQQALSTLLVNLTQNGSTNTGEGSKTGGVGNGVFENTGEADSTANNSGSQNDGESDGDSSNTQSSEEDEMGEGSVGEEESQESYSQKHSKEVREHRANFRAARKARRLRAAKMAAFTASKIPPTSLVDERKWRSALLLIRRRMECVMVGDSLVAAAVLCLPLPGTPQPSLQSKRAQLESTESSKTEGQRDSAVSEDSEYDEPVHDSVSWGAHPSSWLSDLWPATVTPGRSSSLTSGSHT